MKMQSSEMRMEQRGQALDQSVNGPGRYLQETEYTREQIDAALATEDKEVRRQMVKTSDVSGHGTAVAGIAAGNGRGSEGRRFRGAAPEAELIIVKMGPDSWQ